MRGVEWAAGLFEGEGCVCIARRNTGAFATEIARRTVSLSLTSTDPDVIQEFHRIVGHGYIAERPWFRKQGHKPSWRWQTKSLREVTAMIEMLQPFMLERRSGKMDEALATIEAKRLRRVELGREQLGGKRKTIVRDEKGRYAA